MVKPGRRGFLRSMIAVAVAPLAACERAARPVLARAAPRTAKAIEAVLLRYSGVTLECRVLKVECVATTKDWIVTTFATRQVENHPGMYEVTIDFEGKEATVTTMGAP